VSVPLREAGLPEPWKTGKLVGMGTDDAVDMMSADACMARADIDDDAVVFLFSDDAVDMAAIRTITAWPQT
jgi:hypothetical protein